MRIRKNESACGPATLSTFLIALGYKVNVRSAGHPPAPAARQSVRTQRKLVIDLSRSAGIACGLRCPPASPSSCSTIHARAPDRMKDLESASAR